jgi:hypothetical protein
MNGQEPLNRPLSPEKSVIKLIIADFNDRMKLICMACLGHASELK